MNSCPSCKKGLCIDRNEDRQTLRLSIWKCPKSIGLVVWALGIYAMYLSVEEQLKRGD